MTPLKITDMIQALRDKKISSEELCQQYLKRIKKLNPQFKALLTVNEKALDGARHVDQNPKHFQTLPLAGVPILLKDNFLTKGLRTTAASRMLKNFIPPYSATVVERLKRAGAVILGKCNMDEFAMGNSNETSAFGAVPNPWNRHCVAGGSSGGSAAAVSAGLAPVALGTDTGGSLRQPASFCNLVGFKPTYGRISRYGIIAYGSSLDQAGPLSSYVEDTALFLQVLSGADPKDQTCSHRPVPDWLKNLKPSLKGLKVAFLDPASYEQSLSPEVLKIMEQIRQVFVKQGAEVKNIHLPFQDMAVPVYYLISTSEASSNLARYDGIRYGYRSASSEAKSSLEKFYCLNRSEGFGSEVKRRILMGTYCLSKGYYEEYYGQASRIRRQMRDHICRLFKDLSLLISPVADPAFQVGENPAGSLKSYQSDSFTVLANLCGLPAVSVPAGFSQGGLPVGVQFMAAHFEEQSLLNAAFFLQKELEVAGRSPDLSSLEGGA